MHVKTEFEQVGILSYRN